MLARKIFLIMISTVVLWTGGCSKEGDEKNTSAREKNALDEYASTLLSSLDKAKRAQLQASLPAIRLKINQFKQERGRYPDSLRELTITGLPVMLLHYDPETGEVSLAEQDI